MICAELTSLSLRWSYRQSRMSKVSIIVAVSKKVQCGNYVSEATRCSVFRLFTMHFSYRLSFYRQVEFVPRLA